MAEYFVHLVSHLDPLRYLFDILVCHSKVYKRKCLSRSLGLTSGYR